MEEYIKKYCKKHEVSEEEAKTHAIVKEVEAYYNNPVEYNVNQTMIFAGCGGAMPGGDCK